MKQLISLLFVAFLMVGFGIPASASSFDGVQAESRAVIRVASAESGQSSEQPPESAQEEEPDCE